jgi:hypothetical protein
MLRTDVFLMRVNRNRRLVLKAAPYLGIVIIVIAAVFHYLVRDAYPQAFGIAILAGIGSWLFYLVSLQALHMIVSRLTRGMKRGDETGTRQRG